MRGPVRWEWHVDGMPLPSRTLVEIQFASGKWVCGLFLWSGKFEDLPLVRLLLAGTGSAPPVAVDIQLPATALLRRAPMRI